MELYNKYKKMFKLTKEQRRLINEGNFDKLIKLLDKKQELIDEIDQADLKKYLKDQPNPKKLLSDLRQLMKKIKELEEENEKNLKEKKERLTDEMQDFNQKQRSRASYQKPNGYEAKFIDKKS